MPDVRYFFEPPYFDEMPRTTSRMGEHDARFWSHFRRNPVGRNLFKTTLGTYTTVQPDRDLIAHIYFGGHIEEVDSTEKVALEAAGYTVTTAGTPDEVTDIELVGDLLGVLVGDLVGVEIGDL